MQTLRDYDAKALWQVDLDHCMHPWTDFSDWPRTGSTIMVRGEGAYVWNAEGEKFIDGIGGLWFANVGFGRQELIDAATRQLGMLPQYSYFTDIGNPPATERFQLHGATHDGAPVLRRKLSRVKVLEFLASRPPCLVVMETCGGAHHWDRGIQQLGHEVRSIAPVYVKLFVKRRQKSGARDSAAIVEAAHRPMMQFVRKPNPRPPHLRPCPDCARGYTTAPLRLASRALRPPPPS